MSGPEPPAPPIHATVHALTHPGCVRTDNQDCFLVADLSAPAAEGPWRVGTDPGDAAGAERFAVGPRGLLAVVADGMGGAAAGAIASRLAVAEVYGAMAEPWPPDAGPAPGPFARRLRAAVERANDAIHRHARREPACAGMGTTLTVAGIMAARLVLAQVGDSRAYLVRDGRATQITRDQSLMQSLLDAGTLTAVEAERRGLASVLLQALGPEPRVAVDVYWQRLRRGDVLVLCSDGLSRTVGAGEIAAHARRIPDPAALCGALLHAAIGRGATDNVTVLAARLDGAGLEGNHPAGRHVDVPRS
jgi:serine/threonine protein phosphatase PrpC